MFPNRFKSTATPTPTPPRTLARAHTREINYLQKTTAMMAVHDTSICVWRWCLGGSAPLSDDDDDDGHTLETFAHGRKFRLAQAVFGSVGKCAAGYNYVWWSLLEAASLHNNDAAERPAPDARENWW